MLSFPEVQSTIQQACLLVPQIVQEPDSASRIIPAVILVEYDSFSWIKSY